MLIAIAVMLVGLLAGIVAAQLYGLRLGGVIIVPLVAVYLLRSFGTFPVFLSAAVAAYAAVWLVKRRFPLYGRQLFVLSILVGAAVPVTVFELLAVGIGSGPAVTELEFVGSVLPGIAAYNYHRQDMETRILDAVVSLAVLLFLVVVGIGFTILVGVTPLSETTPPLLLGPGSDIAIGFDLVVERQELPIIASSRLALALLALGMGIAEFVRSRYGLRLAGVIVLPLIGLISFRNGVMLPAWVLTVAAAYAATVVVHRLTLLYGRVLLAAAVIFGLLTVVSLTTVLQVRGGLLPFFVGLLGGVTAYNLHVVPRAERPATLAVTLGALVVIGLVTRLFVIPPPRGLLSTVSAWDLRVAGLLLLPAVWTVARFERMQPSLSRVSPASDLEGRERQ